MKITNKTLETYMDLKNKMKEIQAEIDVINDALKEYGSFETSQYSVQVSEASRQNLKIADVIKVFGEAKVQPLITTTTYKIAKVVGK